MKISVFKKEILISLLICLVSYSGTLGQENVGSAAYIYENDIYLPFNSKGIIAVVNVAPFGSTGQFAGGTFLFSLDSG